MPAVRYDLTRREFLFLSLLLAKPPHPPKGKKRRMTTLDYTFEGNADENDVTTSDTGAGNAFHSLNKPAQGGSPAVSQIKYDTAFFAHGSVGGRFRTTDAGSTFASWNVSGTESYIRVHGERPTTLPGNRSFCTIRDASSNICNFRFTSGGAVQLVDAGSVARYTSTKTFSSGEDFRFEAHVVHNATNGHMEARLFYGANIDGTTPDEAFGSATDNWNTGAAAASVRFGAITTAGAGTNEIIALDDLQWNDVSWPGPVGGGGGGGGGGTPATLPDITAPNTTGWTVLVDPNPGAVWTPSLSAGVDYVLTGTAPWVRSKRLNVSGGRNVYISDLTIDIDVAGGTMLDIRAGDGAREVFIEDIYLTNTAGVESDGIRGSSAAGGNIATGSGGTTLKGLRVRVDGLQGSDAGVHADCIQLPGGMREIWFQDSTFKSGYVCLQLQREQFTAIPLRNVVTLTRSGTTGTVEVTGGLAIGVGDWVELAGQTPTDWRSTWQVLSILTGTSPNVTRFTVFLGDGGQGTMTVPGTAQRSDFVNYIGNVNLKNVNLRRQDNASGDPTQTLTGIRIPAGRPDNKGSNAEDRTPLLVDGMAGNLTMDNVWIEPNSGETIADMVEPSNAAVVYDLAQGVENTAATPDEFAWPDHPKIFGILFEGVPGGGDFAPAPGAGVTAVGRGSIPAFTGQGFATGAVTAASSSTIPPFTGQGFAESGTAAPGVAVGPSVRPIPPLPTVSWTIAAHVVEVSGWSPTCSNGGFDQMRGEITEEAWRDLEAAGAKQGSPVVGWCSSGEVMWAGRLSLPPHVHDGVASLAAQGHMYAAAKRNDLFIQARGTEGWVPTDSEPHLSATGGAVYNTNPKIQLDVSGARAKFKIDKDESLLNGKRNGIIFYREGVNFARVGWTAHFDPVHESANLKIQPYVANGPTGAESPIGSGRPTSSTNNGVAREETFEPDDLVMLALEVTADHTNPTENRVYRLAHLKINSDICLIDTFSAYEVTRYIASEVGWDPSGVAESAFNVLPFDHQGDWLEALRYVDELEDRFTRVLEDRGQGPYVERGEWGATTWTVAKAQGAAVDLTPLELYDEVKVFYENTGGIRRRAVASNALGVDNSFSYELADRQPDANLAQAVANHLLARLSKPRYAGTVEIVAARSEGGNQNPYMIRYGDELVISDFGPSQALRLRVVDVTYGPGGVTATVERPWAPVSLVERLRRRR